MSRDRRCRASAARRRIGSGWHEPESAAHGIALGSPAERSDRFEEARQVPERLASALAQLD